MCVCVSVSVCCDVRRMVVLITQVDARSVASRASYGHCSGPLCNKALTPVDRSERRALLMHAQCFATIQRRNGFIGFALFDSCHLRLRLSSNQVRCVGSDMRTWSACSAVPLRWSMASTNLTSQPNTSVRQLCSKPLPTASSLAMMRGSPICQMPNAMNLLPILLHKTLWMVDRWNASSLVCPCLFVWITYLWSLF